jgi:hypothetical protein
VLIAVDQAQASHQSGEGARVRIPARVAERTQAFGAQSVAEMRERGKRS